MAMATKVVSPASETSQPQSRVMGWVNGRRASSMASSTPSENTR